MKYAVLTFGCRTNQADSADIERELDARGGEMSSPEAADLVVVNTCAVTAMAEQAARQAIRRVARRNPAARIVATGCYAEREPSALAQLPLHGVTPRLGSGREPSRFSHLAPPPDIVQLFANRARCEKSIESRPDPKRAQRTLFLLRVQTGCDERCTYCIVPFTRGPARSMPLDQVSRRVNEAADAGFQQAMITGVHLGSYGRDLAPRHSLADLVAMLARHTADVGFRLSAIEPMDIDEAFLEHVAAAGNRFARHFHVPLQHASDRLLSAMGRPYRIADYAAKVDALRDRFPDAAIGADALVGFPGETESDFEALVAYVASSPLTYLHVFPFSPRPGTVAASLGGRPAGVDVRRRVNQLRAMGAEASRRFRVRFIGTARDGLTIGDGRDVLTDNYLRVRVAPGLRRNQRVRVRILADGTGEIDT